MKITVAFATGFVGEPPVQLRVPGLKVKPPLKESGSGIVGRSIYREWARQLAELKIKRLVPAGRAL